MSTPTLTASPTTELTKNRQGKVWLIGAGPGDPDLLTVKAARQLQRCTIWLVDDLAGQAILELASPQTRIIHVGKRGGCVSTSQQFILRLMARYARQGHAVARLKGGDPFIFGRGGEEMIWLTQRGILVEAISGITAGLAVGSALGLPLTHRGCSRGVVLVTAHTADGSQPCWEALAASGLSVVCYMGMSNIDELTHTLLAAGFTADLPVAVVQNVSSAAQRQLTTTLSELAQKVKAHDLGSPSVIVLGRVVGLAQHASLDLDQVSALALAV
ncbi:uroporphyrinogen-III C-methyltransferase [Pollutimonas harenae]|uniref:uroporphyrinogen-III C-methyltransferase n=1 Tax=Pollutimonas harenae TaxID=657015 RepID=A0A853GYU3_9BURK|nr:uroporphyrinogen-III C-methyltransferase [Pollutimonas harenae]NYT84569.1 uroporphyrinogen-III C-methyltransferase [Pollutimonas harenae]TEA73038.1 uroporphyrinogen-III C-methyltransferase [Pollutimonas harenae]